MTDGMKFAAGLTVRKTTPTRKPAPRQQPVLEVVTINGRTVGLRLRQAGAKRAKPADVTQATILTALGEAKPLSAEGWQFGTMTTQTDAEVTFPPSETGGPAWITAFWSNAGGMGPGSTPIMVNLPAGGAIQVASAKPSMKLRAAA